MNVVLENVLLSSCDPTVYNIFTMSFVVFSHENQFKQGMTQRVFFESNRAPYVQPVFVYAKDPYGVMLPVVRDVCASYNDGGSIVSVTDIVGVGTPRSFTLLSMENDVLQAKSFAIVQFNYVPIAVKIRTTILDYDTVCRFQDESCKNLYMFGKRMGGKHEGNILFSDGEILEYREIEEDCVSVKDAIPLIILRAFANLFQCDSMVCKESMFVDVHFRDHEKVTNIAMRDFNKNHCEVQAHNLKHGNLGDAAKTVPKRQQYIMKMYMTSEIRTECIDDVIKNAICKFVPPTLTGTDSLTSIVPHQVKVDPFTANDYEDADAIINKESKDAFQGIEHNVLRAVHKAMEDMVPPEDESDMVQDDSDLPARTIEEDDKENLEFEEVFYQKQEMIIFVCARATVAGDAMFCEKPEFKRKPVRISKPLKKPKILSRMEELD